MRHRRLVHWLMYEVKSCSVALLYSTCLSQDQLCHLHTLEEIVQVDHVSLPSALKQVATHACICLLPKQRGLYASTRSHQILKALQVIRTTQPLLVLMHCII